MRPLWVQDDAALREPLPAQAEKQWATHDRSKLAASSGRGVVVLAGEAHKYASQEVVWQFQERRASGRHDFATTPGYNYASRVADSPRAWDQDKGGIAS